MTQSTWLLLCQRSAGPSEPRLSPSSSSFPLGPCLQLLLEMKLVWWLLGKEKAILHQSFVRSSAQDSTKDWCKMAFPFPSGHRTSFIHLPCLLLICPGLVFVLLPLDVLVGSLQSEHCLCSVSTTSSLWCVTYLKRCCHWDKFTLK